MEPTLCLLVALVMFVASVAISRRLKRKKRTGPRGFGRSYPRLGNALHALQSVAEPRAPFAIQEQIRDEVEHDEAVEQNDPVRHLHRQAARIRNGEAIDRVTALLPERGP